MAANFWSFGSRVSQMDLKRGSRASPCDISVTGRETVWTRAISFGCEELNRNCCWRLKDNQQYHDQCRGGLWYLCLFKRRVARIRSRGARHWDSVRARRWQTHLYVLKQTHRPRQLLLDKVVTFCSFRKNTIVSGRASLPTTSAHEGIQSCFRHR